MGDLFDNEVSIANGVVIENATGGSGADAITGNDGSNLIDDHLVEGAGGGSDLLAARMTYVLESGVSVETLRTTSTANTTAISLAGNEFGQKIVGNAGANTLNGRGGHDTLQGLGGVDAFVFDRSASSANHDHIVDFAHGVDKVRLDHDVFTTLAVGNLDAAAFKDISLAAKDADDRVIYNHANGGLYYDADGSGSGAQQLVAILDNHATMTASDFLVIA